MNLGCCAYSNMFNPAPTAVTNTGGQLPISPDKGKLAISKQRHSRNRLLNLTGFFSSFGGIAGAAPGRPAISAVGVDIIWELLSNKGARTEGVGCFFASRIQRCDVE